MKRNKPLAKTQKKTSKKLSYSLRTLGFIFALFLSLFAFDTGSIFGTLVHLTPTFLIIISTGLSWISQRYSGLAFITLGLISIFFFDTYRETITFLLVTLPMILIGILFYISFYLGVEKNIVKQKR